MEETNRPNIDSLRKFVAKKLPWVVFENGTIVMVREPGNDIRAKAIELMKEFGVVEGAGSSSADFQVFELDDELGWIVSCHHPDIFTYCWPEEFLEDGAERDPDGSLPDTPGDLIVGLLGRGKRGEDAEKLNIIHVESVP